MKSVLKVLPLIFFTAIPASAQDPELRREAVQLLERANGVSLSPKLPNLERVDTFRFFDSSSGPQEGTFTRVVVQGTGRREESRFGEYHSLDIWTGGRLATMRKIGRASCRERGEVDGVGVGGGEREEERVQGIMQEG